MPFVVYVLQSQSTNKRYIGHTEELARRLAEHNDPSHNVRKYTSRNRGPWVLVLEEHFETRSEAMRRERWLKSGQDREWLGHSIGRASPPQAD